MINSKPFISFCLGLVLFSVSFGFLSGQTATTIKLDDDIDRLVLSEDEKFLALVHYEENFVSILDCESLEIIKKIAIEKPGPGISRNGKLYLSQSESGFITVISEENWEIVDELDSGVTPISLISAPLGTYFKDQILVSSKSSGGSTPSVTVLDVMSDEFKVLSADKNMLSAQMFGDGESILITTSDRVVIFPTEAYLSNGNGIAYDKPSSNKAAFPSAHPEFWFSGKSIMVGDPPEEFTRFSATIIPDNDPEFNRSYRLNSREGTVSIHNLDDKFSLAKTIVIPDLKKIHLSDYYVQFSKRSDNRAWARTSKDGVVRIFKEYHDRLTIISFPYQAPPNSSQFSGYSKRLPKAKLYTLVSAPDGASVTEEGLLEWKPESVEPGSYRFKVKMENESGLKFFRETVSITQSQKPPTDFFRLRTANKKSKFSVGQNDEILVLDKDRIIKVSREGKITPTGHTLSSPYQDIVHVNNGIALVNKSRVDFFSSKLEPQKQIEIENGIIRNVCANHGEPYVYLAVEDRTQQDMIDTAPIYRVDIRSEEVNKLDRVFGNQLAVDPRGEMLITSFSKANHIQQGLFNFSTQYIDLMMGYQRSGDRYRLFEGNQQLANSIKTLRFSAKGDYIGVGGYWNADYGINTRAVSIFSSQVLEKPKSLLSLTGDFGAIAMHPQLDLVGVLSLGNQKESLLEFFDISGEKRSGLLKLENSLPHLGKDLFFTGDGESVILRARDIYGRPILKKIPLHLSEKEKDSLSKGNPEPVHLFSSDSSSDKSSPTSIELAEGISMWQYNQLLKQKGKKISPEMISAFYNGSVVIIEGKGIGTGFFVSETGHIITAAHCVPSVSVPKVHYVIEGANSRSEYSAEAIVIDIDQESDLALLKINPELNRHPLSIATRKAMQGGSVYVIGHPGLENLTLNYTMTSGIVSNAKRVIEDIEMLQVSAAVNPGNSGGPVFNDFGEVIGMISQKANLEGASFAVPAESLIKFIRKTRTEKNEPESRKVYEAALQKAKKEGFYTYTDVTFRNGVALFNSDDSIFSGTIVVLRQDGTKFSSIDYKDGKTSGGYAEYYRSEKLKKKYQFEKGVRHGHSAYWYPSGNLEREYWVVNDARTGFFREYNDKHNSVRSAIHYSGGVKHGPSYEMDPLGRVLVHIFYIEEKASRSVRSSYQSREPGKPLIEFAKVGDLEMLARLKSQGENINKLQGKTAAFHEIIENGFHYQIKEFIELGGDVNVKDSKGKMPIDLVMEKDQVDAAIMKILIDAGATTDHLDPEVLKAHLGKE